MNQADNRDMAKKAKTSAKRRLTNRDLGGRPPTDPATHRSGRLVLRVHPDFMATLTLRADEQRMTRSRFVEEILMGVLALDPRNPRFDKFGRIDPKAATAQQRQLNNPISYLNQIAAFSGLNASVFPQLRPQLPPGWTPPQDENEK
jgi:hypothetical protein